MRSVADIFFASFNKEPHFCQHGVVWSSWIAPGAFVIFVTPIPGENFNLEI